jgi:hypothetical protein
MAEVIAEIGESGELPRTVKANIEANSNGSGTHRDAD